MPVSEAPCGVFDVSSSSESPAREVFLREYWEGVLLSVELPAIAQACGHARRGEVRELISQDQSLAASLRETPFAGPSQQAGRARLLRMRPLRDDRLVQRYMKAVESGQAHGWHTLVYGVTLAVYSLPLRQGLLFYAQETMAALAGAPTGGSNVLTDLLERLPAAVSASIAAAETTVHL